MQTLTSLDIVFLPSAFSEDEWLLGKKFLRVIDLPCMHANTCWQHIF